MKFDLKGKGNLVPVSREFKLSEFHVIEVLLYHLPGMLSSRGAGRGVGQLGECIQNGHICGPSVHGPLH